MSRKMVVVFIILLLMTDFLVKAATIQRTAEDVDDSAQLLRVKRRGRGGGSYRTRTRVGGGSYGTRGSMSKQANKGMGGKSDTLNAIFGMKAAVLVGLLFKSALGGGGGRAVTDYPIISNITPALFLPPVRMRRKRYLELDAPTPSSKQIRQ